MPIAMWNEQDLSKAISSGQTLLVDLQADWCVQCGPQEQVLERVAPDYDGDVLIASVDVGEHPAIVDEYGISGLPALLLFKDGTHRETLCGFQRAPLLHIALKKLLASD